MAKGSQMMDYLNFNGNFNGNFVNFETSKLYYVSTVIPRLARILIARICIARIFEAAKNNSHSTILYL